MPNKIINLHTDYTQFESNYQLCLPLEMGIQLKQDDPVRLLSELLEALDYSKLIATYAKKGTNPALPPVIMFKVFVYAYLRGHYSTRKIEELCYDSVACQWLLGGRKAPSHDAFQRFRRHHLGEGVIEDLFFQFNEILFNLDEIQFENLFIDGTKLQANANCYTFKWKKAIVNYRSRLYDKISAVIGDFNDFWLVNLEFDPTMAHALLDKCLVTLSNMIESQKIEFVHGAGKRKTIPQKLFETMKEYKKKLREYDETLEKIGNNRSSMSKTDEDATFMRMKDDHMKNGQLKPGYNVQIGVEAGYIVACDIFQKANDLNTLVPFINSFSSKISGKYKNIIADAGYESEENYKYLKEKGYNAYIKPTNYEQRKTRKFKKQIGRKENMTYDETKDEYTCAQGRKLVKKDVLTRQTKTGYKREVSVYESKTCKRCPLREQCTKAAPDKKKKIEVSKNMEELRQESEERIITEFGKQLRINRSIQVEGAFGAIKNNQGFNRFLTRGTNNVHVEFLLLSLAFNIRKLHNKIQNDKCGHYLHEMKNLEVA